MKKRLLTGIIALVLSFSFALAGTTYVPSGQAVAPKITINGSMSAGNYTPTPVPLANIYTKFKLYTQNYGPTPTSQSLIFQLSPDGTNYYSAVTMTTVGSAVADTGTTIEAANYCRVIAAITQAPTSTPASSPTPGWTPTPTVAVGYTIIGCN